MSKNTAKNMFHSNLFLKCQVNKRNMFMLLLISLFLSKKNCYIFIFQSIKNIVWLFLFWNVQLLDFPGSWRKQQRNRETNKWFDGSAGGLLPCFMDMHCSKRFKKGRRGSHHHWPLASCDFRFARWCWRTFMEMTPQGQAFGRVTDSLISIFAPVASNCVWLISTN